MPVNNTKAAITVQALDRPLELTSFTNKRAMAKKELSLSLRTLASKIERQTAISKDKLPWLKLATFGDAKSAKGCLRTNANVATVTGLEADYDAGVMTPEEARDKLSKAGVAALIYTTPSHTADAPRWRVLCPFSGPLSPDAREDLMARLNGVLGGALAGESFTLSQAYYAGNVEGSPKVQTFLVEGDYLDKVNGLTPIYKDGGKAKPERAASTGEKTGLPFAELQDALMAVPNDESNPKADDREWWLGMLAALHHETDGDKAGLELAHEWSALHPSYDPDATDATWLSFRRGSGKTGASILSEACYHGWHNKARDGRLLGDGFTDEVLARFDLDPSNPLSEIDAMLLADDEDIAELARGYDLTEDGVIRAFSDRHEGELLFDHTAGAWFRFGSHRWERETTLLAKHYARAVSTELAKRDTNAKHLKKVSVWEAVERGARTVRAFAVDASVWDRDSFLLGTPGGVVDLKTGKLRTGRPHDHISKATAAAPVPLGSFDPKRHCPRWIKFLQEALGSDAEAIRFLQQWFGYCLTGDTSEHALVFVYGPGGSGKSTAINVMADLLGDYAINVATSTLTKAKHDAHPEELARMDGARLAFASETEKGKAWAENRIKSLTGGDKITARHMRQNSFEFVPQMKLVIVGNNQPSLSDVDSAIQRRFNILPFDHPPKTKDAKLVDKLRTEFPGILSWAIQGALDWQAHGLDRPQMVDTATSAYFAEQDTFGRWLEEKCDVGGPERDTSGLGFVDTADCLWESWQHYAYANGEDPGSKLRVFPETMEQRGFKRVKNRGGIRGRGFAGVRLQSGNRDDANDLL
ncbi:MAG: phage/plasmid primase, P4 family [Sulfitobacter sp.]